MNLVKTKYGRRSFIKHSAMAGGGLMLGFSWLAGCKPKTAGQPELPDNWFEINGFLKIGENGVVTIYSPNPEIGQNVKTSMPMIVAEELDVEWEKVLVEQAPLNTDIFTRQLAGGSQAIRQGWEGLRMAGATARTMLRQAAAQSWQVPVEEVTTNHGFLSHAGTKKNAGYGEMASAAALLNVPEEVELKEYKDFTIIGTSRKNVDAKKIVTGQSLFGLDYQAEGMLIAMIVHPPAFGLRLKSVDSSAARSMPGIRDVFTIKTYEDDYVRNMFDVSAFNELVVIVGNSTWEVMNAKKTLKPEWERFEAYTMTFGGDEEDDTWTKDIPGGLESSSRHDKDLAEWGVENATEVRLDGDPEKAFRQASKIIECRYSAPFLAHNTMEPMNFFAHVYGDRAVLVGPTQTPEYMEKSLSARLGIPLENIDIQMSRMGGGFGRRLYGHFMVEAAVISQKMQAPVKLVYSREDDMSDGVYRSPYHAYFRAALDEDNQMIAYHVRAGGLGESPVFANRFPAGAVDHYLAEKWSIGTNISTGAFRAPRSNFIAGAEQSFLDEVAAAAGKDPIDFRLELLARAQEKPVGEENDYDPERYAGVLKLVKEKSDWAGLQGSAKRGVAAYYCHHSYAAAVVDLSIQQGQPIIEKVSCAVDCGIVVNPDAATNLVEGGIVDALGCAMYGQLTIKEGEPQQNNFDKYRMIRINEAPKSIDVHFVENEIDPTGLGEPPFPPVFGALANALFQATGKRYYDQPFFE